MSDSGRFHGAPRAGRFVRGRSGNPKGRPRLSREATGSAFDIVIDKTLTVIQDGRAREVTVEEALQHRTYQDAVAGNRSARREVLKMIEKRERYLAARMSRPKLQVDRRIEPHDPDNADAAMLILGIAGHDPGKQPPDYPDTHLLLEPWAVQAALRRRSGGRRLTDKEVAEIKRSTRNADTLRWPRGTGK